MGEKCQLDDNISSSDQVSHNLSFTVTDNKTSVSTFSSEMSHSTNHTSVKTDVSSDSEQTLNGKRKISSTLTAEEISQGDSTTMIIYPHKQLKVDSPSSRNSGTVAKLSSIDSIDPKPTISFGNRECESKKVFQEPEYSMTTKLDYEFDLNEDMEANAANCWHLKSNVLSEPIPVVAKLGIPMGYPKKPLQFGGELGWKISGITSAFHPTSLKNPDVEKAPIPREFDLNIAATIDPEFPIDEASERYHFNGQKRNGNCHRPSTLGIDLNHNPMIEEAACKSIYPQRETRQFLSNYDAIGTVNCSQVSASSNMNYTRAPYWVDLSSVKGYGQLQGPSFLLGAPNAEQVQMVVPIQLPYTPPGFYIGKINGMVPTLYPPTVLSPLNNQPGPAVLSTYPGNVRVLENSQGFNPNVFANMRQTTVSNGSITVMENGSNNVGNSYGEQVAFPGLYAKRLESDVGWGSSQVNCRQLAAWK